MGLANRRTTLTHFLPPAPPLTRCIPQRGETSQSALRSPSIKGTASEELQTAQTPSQLPSCSSTDWTEPTAHPCCGLCLAASPLWPMEAQRALDAPLSLLLLRWSHDWRTLEARGSRLASGSVYLEGHHTFPEQAFPKFSQSHLSC